MSPAAYAAEFTATFPGAVTALVAPDGRYSIDNVDYDNKVPHHVLLLVFIKTKQQVRLYPYNRHVDVSWAPDSRHLFINDFAGSDNADCIIYNVLTKKLVSVASILHKNKFANSLMNDNGHVYVTCSNWIANKGVDVQISGYGTYSPNGFSDAYKYIFGGEPDLIKSK